MTTALRATLYRGGRIYGPGEPAATAMLVVGGRIAWVGTEQRAEGLAGDWRAGVNLVEDQHVVDLAGALVTPAFVDAHVHLTETALARDGLDLAGVASLADLLELVADRVRERPGEVVMGFGWEEDGWPEGRAPAPDDLDKVAGGALVYLARRDVHTAAVSSSLLALDETIAAVDGWEGGLVRRDAHHRARAVARAAVDGDRLRELRVDVLRHAASLGIAAVHEMGSPQISGADDFSAVLALGGGSGRPDVVGVRGSLAAARSSGLPDVVGYWGDLDVDGARRLGAAGAAGDLNVDGSLGSRSAWLSVPYADAPSERGRRYLDEAAATAHVVACTKAGMQAGFHCIGDEGVRTAVAAITGAAKQCGLEEVVARRHRLEHVEMIGADLIDELARLGVVASVQPAFDALWGGRNGLYADRLGPERAAMMNPFATMAAAGVTLAFGSDSPVTPVAGWETVRAAVRHHTPSQRLDLETAFAAATVGGWRAARIDDAGVLAPGMLASFAVWDLPTNQPGAATLPDLSPGVAVPRCLRTVARGDGIWPT